MVERLDGFHGLQVVLYTKIAPDIDELKSEKLAELAIWSARSPAGARRHDGISYLINAKGNGITTPLTDEYEKEILRRTDTKSLEDAWKSAREGIC